MLPSARNGVTSAVPQPCRFITDESTPQPMLYTAHDGDTGSGSEELSPAPQFSWAPGLVRAALVDRSGNGVSLVAAVHVWMAQFSAAPLRREDRPGRHHSPNRRDHLPLETHHRRFQLDR